MDASPKAGPAVGVFRPGVVAGADDHGRTHTKAVLPMRYRFNPTEWNLWFATARALKRFAR